MKNHFPLVLHRKLHMPKLECQIKEILNKYKNVKFSKNITDATKNADLIIIHTEWNEFKELNLKKLLKNKKVIVYDMRNIYSAEKMKKIGIKYHAIGR